jgi:ribonuclease-3
MEALIATIYLDRGMEIARDFIMKIIEEKFSAVISQSGGINYKSMLQEMMQAKHMSPPVYLVVEECGLPHDRTFTVEARAGDRVLGTGSGSSKKAAEMEAARAALGRFE